MVSFLNSWETTISFTLSGLCSVWQTPWYQTAQWYFLAFKWSDSYFAFLDIVVSCVLMSYHQIIFSLNEYQLFIRQVSQNVYWWLWDDVPLAVGFVEFACWTVIFKQSSAQSEASGWNFTSGSVSCFYDFTTAAKKECLFFSLSRNYAQLLQKSPLPGWIKKAETPFDAQTEEIQLPARAVVCHFPWHCPVFLPELKQ